MRKRRKRKYGRDILLLYLRRLAKDLDKTPSALNMDKAKHYPNSSTFIYEFTTWNNALREAGLTLNKLRKYSDEDLITLLRILANRLNKSPSAREMDFAQAFPDSKVYIQRFDSWSKALIMAGIKPNKRKTRYSDVLLIELLRNLAKKLGRSPAHDEMNRQQGYPCGNTFRDRFDTWNKALEKAGLEKRNRLYG
ncbi:MAG: hypothetical protein U9O94_07170 [Nanoarchaeota archaeon]|nr:hypothetical protein [Nanoarchaeota archaeon]